MKNTLNLVDCHQHLIYPDQYPYSWTDDIPQLAGKAFTCENYEELVRDLGDVRTIFMETAPDHPHGQAESRFVQTLADQPDSKIDGLILNCSPEGDEDFETTLESLHHDKLVGFRRVLHVVDDAISEQPLFIQNIRKLAQHNLTFDMCFFARQLPLACKLADHCQEVQFILDHCGCPNVAEQELDPWRATMSELAKRPNVACKISGVLAYANPDNATSEAVRPFVEHSIEAFGWDRVVWGSDWPVVCMTSGLPQWIDITLELMAGEEESNRMKLFHQNAKRIYSLEKSSGLAD